MKIAEAFVELRVDSKGTEQDVRRQAQGLGSTFAQVFGAAAFGAGLKKAIDSGSKLEQSVGAIEAVFGKNQRTIDEWAKGAAKSMGLAESEAREALTLMGAQLKNFGFSVDEARDRGMGLVELAGDLAATFGGTTTEAVEALTAALRGEMDPIERYGVSLNDVRLKAKALEMGLYTGKGSLESNAKASAALALITEQTAAAHGQFARELDTVAGKQAVARAEAENAAASFGQAVAPIYERLVETVTWLAEGFGGLPEPVQFALVALLGFVALSGPIGSFTGAIKAATTAIRGMGAAAATSMLAAAAVVAVALVAWSAFREEEDLAAKKAEELGDSMRAAASSIDAHAVALLSAADAAEQYGDAVFESADEAMREMVRNTPRAVTAMNELGISMEDVVAASRSQAQAQELANRILAEATERGYEFTWTNNNSVEVMKDGKGATDEFSGGVVFLTNRLKLAGEASKLTAEQQVALARALDVPAIVALKSSGNWDMLTAAEQEAADAALLVADSQAGIADTLDTTAKTADTTRLAIDDLATAFAGLLGTLDANDASRDAAEAMDRFRTASEEAYFAAITGAEDFEAKQRAAEQAADDLKRKVIAYGDEVGDLPAERVTDILALIDQGKLDEAQALLDELERARTVTFEVVVNGAGKKISFSPTTGVVALAEGGVMRRATPAIVGEAGPEAVLPLSRPGRMAEILADPSVAGPIAAAMGGGGAATNVYLTVNDYGTRRNWLAEVERELRRLKAGG